MMEACETAAEALARIKGDASRVSRRGFLETLAGCVTAAALGAVPVPVEAAARSGASLESRINQYVRTLRRTGHIPPDERTAWSVYDFTNGRKLVAINEDVPLQAASMIKPFVACAYFFKTSERRARLRYTSSTRALMERMLRRSSNAATNQLIRAISRDSGGRGPRDVERVLKRHAPGIFRQVRIVETIPPGGKTYRNKASAHDYSRFLYALWKENFPYAREIRRLMSLPKRNRIRYGVDGMPAGTRVYDKTGTTARLCGDMGIIEVPGRDGRRYPYTVIGIIEKPGSARRFSDWVSDRGDVIRSVSRIVYLHMKARHNLL